MSRNAGDGRGRFGGRGPGTPNRITKDLFAKAEEIGVDPFEGLLRFAKGDWEGLGYQSASRTILSKSGDEIEIDTITPEMRLAAYEKACQYLYPKRKAIDLKTDAGGALRDLMSMPAEERRNLISAYLSGLMLEKGKNE